ncbi:MAG: PorT family protein [Pseudoflavonifractor sp.]|nr:PorT family protein [Pseudoflavonifractor sp.]
MRKLMIALVAVVTMACGVTASAQFRWGAQAGVDITDLTFRQKLFVTDQSVGYTAGVVGEMMFPGIGFGVDAGFLYTQRGATMHLGECRVWAADGYGNERTYLHYIEIPIHLRFKYTNLNGIENYVAPIVFGGPSFDILVGHGHLPALKYAGGDFGLTAGIGIEMWRRWQLTAQYTWGMTYALKTKVLDDFSAKNRSWVVRLSYFF